MRSRELLYLCVLALLSVVRTSVGLRPQGLAFCTQTELSHLVVDDALGTWALAFVFAPINLARIVHVLLCLGPRNAFLATLWKTHFEQHTEITSWSKVNGPQVQIPLTSKAMLQLPHHVVSRKRGHVPGKLRGPYEFVIECIRDLDLVRA